MSETEWAVPGVIETQHFEDILVDVTCVLGTEYIKWKEHEAEKDKAKEAFFEFATERSKERAGERLIEVEPDPDEDEATLLARVKKYNPGWGVGDFRAIKTDGEIIYEIILDEDPALMPFIFVNGADGAVYQRQISTGSVQVDETRMATLDPDLYEEVTFALPWGDRVMRPLKDATPETAARLQKYLYNKKPSVKLAAPREAKLEELENS